MAELIEPFDEYNQALVKHVHPPGWTNPQPSGVYNLVVIGAGTAGLVTAAGAAGLGAKVSLVERHLMGGDCLNIGCVPSKAIISSARVASTIRQAHEFGVSAGEPTVDFGQVMERMRKLRAEIAPNDSATRFRDLGVDVFLGDARFVSGDRVEVAGTSLQFAKAVVATGARAFVPDVPGLREAGFLTNETVFELTQRPDRLAVVGGGPIGCELAQTFASLGSRVVQVEQGGRILPKDDPEASSLVMQSMAQSGVCLRLNSRLQRVDVDGSDKLLHIETPDGEITERVDQILIATGRVPNVDLNLEAAGVRYDARNGIEVDDYLRTSNPRIFAAGDVASKYQFTHAADFLARIAIQNALVASVIRVAAWKRASDLIIPWSTYTSPEVAQVGATENAAAEQGIDVDVYKVDFSHLDRAILESAKEGFVKIVCRQGSDEIIGGTIVAERAGDMIGEITMAMQSKIGLGALASVIHPYPTIGEAIRKAGDQYNKTRLTPAKAKLLRKFFKWTRKSKIV